MIRSIDGSSLTRGTSQPNRYPSGDDKLVATPQPRQPATFEERRLQTCDGELVLFGGLQNELLVFNSIGIRLIKLFAFDLLMLLLYLFMFFAHSFKSRRNF